MTDNPQRERGAKERDIFLKALDKATPRERDAYLDGACGDDAALRAAVESLLQHHQEDSFLENPALAPQKTIRLPDSPVVEAVGSIIGRYKLLQQIGEGGMGVVYMAEQEEPVRRRVALKVIKLGMDTKSVIARFEAERQALALMDHPNIAKVFDAGATGAPVAQASPPASSAGVPPGVSPGGETPPKPAGGDACATLPAGRPYFVMELLRGIRITDYCDQNHLPTQQRLDLFTQICKAIQHAHQKGIIHRDIKPSNILVTLHDGVPVPKIIDFGIAKATSDQRLTDKTLFTAFEQFIGTPAYMSPEQAEMSGLDIDTRSDIYSLGVLLYELLTGQTPFDATELIQAGLDAMRRTIREKEPPKPSTRLTMELVAAEVRRRTGESGIRNPKSEMVSASSPRRLQELINLVRGDLDWIVMKALEKDRARRYDTANDLMADIQRHVHNEPVAARPPSASYRFQKLVRRNKIAFAATSAVVAALIIGLGLSTWLFLREKAARQRAVAAEQKAKTEASKNQQVAQFLKDMLQGVGPSVALGRDTTMLREILDKTADRVGKDLTNQPEVQVELRATLAWTYDKLGLYKQMEDIARETLWLSRSQLGEQHPAVADALGQLGVAMASLGQLGEAETLNRESLAMRKKLLGNEHPDVANSLENVAAVLLQQGKLAEAETVIRESLAMRRKLLGNEHSDLADSLNNLAVVLRDQGKFAEAESLFRESLAMTRKLMGDEHPSVATSLNNLAGVLQKQNKPAEAETMQRDALARQTKLLGNEHPDVANSLNGLAIVLREQGKLAEAETMERESLATTRKLFGNEHPSVANSLDTLALVLQGQGKLAEAETMQRDALAMRRKLLGNEHPKVATSLNDLAIVLESQGKLAEAETINREALAIRRKLLGNEHPAVATSLGGLTRILLVEGKFTEAEPPAREFLAIREKMLPDDPRTFNARSMLGGSLLGQKKYAEAEPLLLSGYEGMKQREDKIPAYGKSRLKESLERLVQLYEETGRSDQAAPWKQKLEQLDQPAPENKSPAETKKR